MDEIEVRTTHIRVGGRFMLADVAVPFSDVRQIGGSRRREGVTLTLFIDDDDNVLTIDEREAALERAERLIGEALRRVREARRHGRPGR